MIKKTTPENGGGETGNGVQIQATVTDQSGKQFFDVRTRWGKTELFSELRVGFGGGKKAGKKLAVIGDQGGGTLIGL